MKTKHQSKKRTVSVALTILLLFVAIVPTIALADSSSGGGYSQ
jgi:hypothetical protein